MVAACVSADCFICRSMRDEDVPWTDKPLFLEPGCGAIVPAVGALSPGYALICPVEHVANFRVAAAAPSVLAFVDDALQFLVGRFGPLTYWEHGGITNTSRLTSACVEHAHIQVIPGEFQFEAPTPMREYGTLFDFLTDERSDWGSKPYLMTGTTGGGCRVGNDVGVAQHFRRQLAKMTGEPDQWDYAAAPNLDNVRKTIAMTAVAAQ